MNAVIEADVRRHLLTPAVGPIPRDSCAGPGAASKLAAAATAVPVGAALRGGPSSRAGEAVVNQGPGI